MRLTGATLILAATLGLVATRARAQEGVLTLEAALVEARRANAVLPVARFDAEGAEAGVGAARGRLLPTLAFDGDVHAGGPNRYATNDGRAQIVAEMPLYDGRLRAGIASSTAAADHARAGYHQAEKDLDLAVRSIFALCLEAEQELGFRRAGIDRLRTYQSVIEARRAGGHGVASDLAKTRVRLGQGEADLAGASLRLAEAKLELNTLLGRRPDAALALADMPLPAAPVVAPPGNPWVSAPEIAQAEADARAAAADASAVYADRLPRVSLLANAGAQPVWGSAKLAPLNNGDGWGSEVILAVNVPLWDAGVQRSRVAEANLAEKSANQRLDVAKRDARLAWLHAVASLRGVYVEVDARARTVETARDSYLQAESLHRGGAGTALDVLDAYDGWITANQAYAESLLRYRVAEAELARWGTP